MYTTCNTLSVCLLHVSFLTQYVDEIIFFYNIYYICQKKTKPQSSSHFAIFFFTKYLLFWYIDIM